ncbi:MAG: hypothetical protein ABR502_00725 [Chitinophagaceae bacterium]
MKKIILVLAVAGIITACNEGADTAQSTKDSIDSAAGAKIERIDSSAEADINEVDSLADVKKEQVDKRTNASKDTSKKD